jgi:hypothetical protein
MIRLRICANGFKLWYSNFQHHRVNGPAVQWSNGDREWYYRDRRVTEYELMMLSAQEQAND